MATLTITLANGRQVPFEVAQDASGPPCFLISMRKCGSSITNNICKAIAESNGRCFVPVGDIFFWNNVPAAAWHPDPSLRELLRPGVIYGGFRDAPTALFEDKRFIDAPKLLLIRDPRDALVSQYFSDAHSHPVPAETGSFGDTKELMLKQRQQAQSTDINEWVLKRAVGLVNQAGRYRPMKSLPNLVVVKYEDIILDKPALIDSLARQFGLTTTPEQVAEIVEWAHVIPGEDNPQAFIRHVLPGDHFAKLGGETIARLNGILAPVMQMFGYAA